MDSARKNVQEDTWQHRESFTNCLLMSSERQPSLEGPKNERRRDSIIPKIAYLVDADEDAYFGRGVLKVPTARLVIKSSTSSD